MRIGVIIIPTKEQREKNPTKVKLCIQIHALGFTPVFAWKTHVLNYQAVG